MADDRRRWVDLSVITVSALGFAAAWAVVSAERADPATADSGPPVVVASAAPAPAAAAASRRVVVVRRTRAS